MMELLKQFAELDAAMQAAVMGTVAYGVVALLRSLGLKTWPGLVSILAGVLTGGALGAVTGGWQGAVLGLLAGLAATGVHQVKRQADKFDADRLALIGRG